MYQPKFPLDRRVLKACKPFAHQLWHPHNHPLWGTVDKIAELLNQDFNTIYYSIKTLRAQGFLDANGVVLNPTPPPKGFYDVRRVMRGDLTPLKMS